MVRQSRRGNPPKRRRAKCARRSWLRSLLCIGTLGIGALHTGVAAAATDDLQQTITTELIAAATKQYPTARITVQLEALPPFIRNRPCAAPTITLKSTRFTGRVPVGLRCAGPKPWSAYVTASVAAWQPIPTACRALPRGHRMQRDDLCAEERNLATVGTQALLDRQDITGKETRRAVRPGSTFSLAVLGAPMLVARGDTVHLRAGRERFSISTLASALNDGRLGQQIRVKNLRSGKQLRAWVVGAGQVSTNPPG